MVTIGRRVKTGDSYNDDGYPGANQGGQGEPIEKPGGKLIQTLIGGPVSDLDDMPVEKPVPKMDEEPVGTQVEKTVQGSSEGTAQKQVEKPANKSV